MFLSKKPFLFGLLIYFIRLHCGIYFDTRCIFFFDRIVYGVANSTVEYSAFKCDYDLLHIGMKQRIRPDYFLAESIRPRLILKGNEWKKQHVVIKRIPYLKKYNSFFLFNMNINEYKEYQNVSVTLS